MSTSRTRLHFMWDRYMFENPLYTSAITWYL